MGHTLSKAQRINYEEKSSKSITPNPLQGWEMYLENWFRHFKKIFLAADATKKKTFYISNSLHPAGGKLFPTTENGYIPPDEISSAWQYVY